MPLSESVNQIIEDAKDADKAVEVAAALVESIQMQDEKFTEGCLSAGEGAINPVGAFQTYALLAQAHGTALVALEMALARREKAG